VLDINDLTKQRASVFGHIDEFRTLILKKLSQNIPDTLMKVCI